MIRFVSTSIGPGDQLLEFTYVRYSVISVLAEIRARSNRNATTHNDYYPLLTDFSCLLYRFLKILCVLRVRRLLSYIREMEAVSIK